MLDLDFLREYEERTESPAETVFFDDVMTALKSAAPEGSTVRAIGFDSNDVFLRAGYRVTDGDCDVCIARGGEKEFTAARLCVHKKLILMPTHDYPAAACERFRTEEKSFACLRTGKKPFGAVFDKTAAVQNHAALFGEIVALDLAAFDVEFSARMDGRRIDGEIAMQIAKLITELTDQLKKAEKDNAAQKSALTDAGRRAAHLLAKTPALLHASGASQAVEAYRMLCVAEKRTVGMRGELLMLFGAYITDFYIKSLNTARFFFPPDNNKRIDSITANLGADVRRTCVHIAPIYPPQKLLLCEYRVREFKSELIKKLTDIIKRQNNAWHVFKRLYPDDGYCLKKLLDKTDAPLCVALAPDVFKSNSMLSYLKQAGRLEKYVI
ncbi:MAG: hypothetical protein J1F69_03825 [Clostridiales bacterium]|nr:hypothetical protein [Clostridiales bacterium]